VVYIREAHPTDGWQTKANEEQGVKFKQPKTEKERAEVAQTCRKDLDIGIPMLMDDMKNSADEVYCGWPDRLYIVSKDGKIAYKGAVGPQGFNPREMEQALEKTLK